MRLFYRDMIWVILFVVGVKCYSVNTYIPRDVDERMYLEKIREEEFILGLPVDEVLESCEHQKGLREILRELFDEYLQLNVRIASGTWHEVYEDFKTGESDAIGLITKKVERQEFTEFSKKLFGENLYLSSWKIKINSAKDLQNQTIYHYKTDSNLPTLKTYLEKQKINANLVGVENILDHKDDIVYVSGLYANGLPYKIEIGHLPYTAIGVSKKYAPLIPIINRALALKYEEEIKNSLVHRRLKVQQNNFKNKLTEEEKKYLKNISDLGIGLEPNSAVSRYSKRRKEVGGIVPELLKKMSIIMEVPYLNKTPDRSGWQELQEKFLKKKIQILPVFNPKDNYGVLSNPICDLEIYLIYNKRSTNEYIGVIQNSVYEEIGKKFIFPEQVKFYNSHDEQENAFEKGRVNGIITAYPNKYDDHQLEVDRIGIMPLALAFHKEDEMLRDIFNKALESLGEIEIGELIKTVYKDENQEILWEKAQAEKLSQFFIGLSFLGIIIILGLCYWLLYEKKLAISLRKDSLTDLPNRVVFNEFCLQHQRKKGVALLLDLDNFKDVNDRFNHKCGDSILAEMGRILKKVFEKEEIFRISGDEFYGFLEKNNWEEKFEKLKKHVENSLFLQNYDISFSLGYYKKEENETLEDAFKYAGMAMKGAKVKKETCLVEATPKLISYKTRALNIKEILKENEKISGEFYIVFQPKFQVSPYEKLDGAEVLCRWTSTELGIISPGEFIPLAEELKRVHMIDFKIAEASIKQLKIWLKENLISAGFRLSFNVSMQTFDREDFLERIETLLRRYQVSGKYLEIEITESTFSQNIPVTLKKLTTLKEMGIVIALDDFTAGHSTTALLSFLPIDILKFDQSLIRLYRNNREKGSIIYQTLLKMAQDLKLKTVAEGVEEEDEYNFLKGKKVDTIQGYYLGKPMRKDEFEKLLKID